MNPEREVFLLFSHDIQHISESSRAYTSAIFSYPNVHVYKIDPIEFTRNTAIGKWMQSGALAKKSVYIVTHVSEVIRIASIAKYSGTYFDLDVVSKKPVRERGSNFACVQRDGLINSAVADLSGDLGRTIAEKNFDHVSKHFDGNSWVGNGPEVLSNIIKQMCNVTDIGQMHRINCYGFEVLPTRDCYSIDYPEWKKFFDPKFLDECRKATKDSFVVHFWNSMSGKEKLSTKSGSFYTELAREYCPKVFETSGDEF
jgi:lactosylceramide 4-alpha-galactosyltransferase